MKGRFCLQTRESSGKVINNQPHEVVRYATMSVEAKCSESHRLLGLDDADVASNADSKPRQMFIPTSVLFFVIGHSSFALMMLDEEAAA